MCSKFFAWSYIKNVQIAPLRDAIKITNEIVYGTHSKMLLKMELRVQMNAKSRQLKNESKIDLFSEPGDAHEKANRTAINAFEVGLMIKYRLHLIKHLKLHSKMHFKSYIKMHKKGIPEIAVKGAL